MLTGHCHCEQIRFEFDGEPTDASFCHCSICRRLTGSAFGAWCEVASKDFRWISGRQNLSTYKVTDYLEIDFCSNCGVLLLARHSSWPDCRYLPLGTIDSDSNILPEYHQFTGSKAAWYEIHDSMPQYQAWPEVES